MRLTDELFAIGRKSRQICTIIDEEHVLLSKTMPETDAKLDDYLDKIKKAHEAGVQIAYVEDYRLIEGATHSFSNGTSYTRGVFLETRAKGTTYERSTYIRIDAEKTTEEIVDSYLLETQLYLEELEKRAQGSFEVYDKLVKDYLKVESMGLAVDPKPLNFFYDEKAGFTLIDPIPETSTDLTEYFPSYIINAVYGYGRPFMYLDDIDVGLPEEYLIRYNKVYKIINEKIIMALKRSNIKEEYIKDGFVDNSKTSINMPVMDREKLIEIVNTYRSTIKNKR